MADGAAGGEEEEVHVRVYLADDGEVDVEMRVEGLDGDVGSEAAVFPFVAKGIGDESSVSGLHHEDYGVEDAGYGGGSQDGGPDDAVGTGEVVAQDRGGVRIGGHAGYVEDSSCPLVGFAEC